MNIFACITLDYKLFILLYIFMCIFRVRPLNANETTRKDVFACNFSGAAKIEVIKEILIILST